jgi:hypothetical protein
MNSVSSELTPTRLPVPAGTRPALCWSTVAGQGALLGAKLAAVYSLAFLAVASVAYWFSVLAAPTAGDLLATLVAGTVSLTVAVLVFGLLCSLVAAVSGALAALALVALLRRLGQPLPVRRVMIVGLAFGLTVAVLGYAVLGYAVLWLAGLWSPGSLASSATLFWLEVPSLVFVGACMYGARRVVA